MVKIFFEQCAYFININEYLLPGYESYQSEVCNSFFPSWHPLHSQFYMLDPSILPRCLEINAAIGFRLLFLTLY